MLFSPFLMKLLIIIHYLVQKKLRILPTPKKRKKKRKRSSPEV